MKVDSFCDAVLTEWPPSVGAADRYTVEACLLGIRDWFGRLLLGIGFATKPAEGFSWHDMVDRQVRYLNGLPQQRSETGAGANGLTPTFDSTLLRGSRPCSRRVYA